MIRAGAPARLTVEPGGIARGRLTDGGAGFMSARISTAHAAAPDVPVIDKRTVHHRHSTLSGGAIDQPSLAFAIWQRLPGIAAFPRPDRVMLTTPDGSWTEATRTTPARIEHGGPEDLWEIIEQAARDWQASGKPSLSSYEITINAEGQSITLSQPPPAAP